MVDGTRWRDSESFYQAQKPVPFDDEVWTAARVNVMRTALRAKFAACAEARELLLSTHPHPLVSIKGDAYWGYDAVRGGDNMLAVLLMELRAALVAGGPALAGALAPGPSAVPLVVSGPAGEHLHAAAEFAWTAALPHLPPVFQQ